MTGEREVIGRKVQEYFEGLWRGGDPWDLEESEFEQAKYERQKGLIEGRRYQRVLELGCGSGCFTRRLAQVADRVVSLDVAPSAITRARAAVGEAAGVEFRVANVMDYQPRAEGPWDLVVLSETIYYVGWLYPLFDVAWLVSELFGSTTQGGRLLMTNAFGGEKDYLQLACLIRTYRDLCVNVGYEVEHEEAFVGSKSGVDVEVLMSLFRKGSRAALWSGART